jgi:hypothetical protein
MLKKIFLGLLSLLTVGQLALVAIPASAQDVNGNPTQLLEQTGLGNGQGSAAAGAQLPILVGRIIRVLLSLLGIIFLVLMVYAGFLWMTARGESDPVDKAKDIIRQAIIGLIIVFLAYALTGFIINSIIKATSGV